MCCFILPDGRSAPLSRLDCTHRPPNLPCAILFRDLEATYHDTAQNRPRDCSATAPQPYEDVSRRWPVEGGLSVPRDNQITVYVTDEMKDRLDERTEDSDETISGFANRALEQRLQAEADDELAREVRADERIRELVSVAADEIQQATEEMRDLNAKTGAYAAANFELLKEGRKDAMRRDALATGSRRMRTDLDIVQENLDSGSQSDGDDGTSMMDRMGANE
jgi:hypothetical protein